MAMVPDELVTIYICGYDREWEAEVPYECTSCTNLSIEQKYPRLLGTMPLANGNGQHRVK